MARYKLRCNLSAAIFPFASDFEGRTIIVPQYDQNYDKSLAATADTDKDKGIPRVYYMHNCMPTAQGFQAVDYTQQIAAMLGAPTDFDKSFSLQNPDANRFLFSPSAGKNYVFDRRVGTWASVNPLVPGTVDDNVLVTSAYIEGETYIYYSGKGCYKYNATTKAMDAVVLIGLVVADVLGICAGSGYLIAWTENAVAWSSTINPLDFTPDVDTGAGGGNVADIKGAIVVCLPIIGGFCVYCEKNIVGATYTGNIQFPFFFKEVGGSGGLVSPDQVSWQANNNEHYAWTTQGLQKVDKTNAVAAFPDVTDFLAAQIFEDWNSATEQLSTTYLSSQLYVKLTLIGNRYLVISYGVQSPELTHALIYDFSLKRWGKVKVQHRDCFQYNEPNIFGILTYGDLANANWLYGDFGISTYGNLDTRISQVDKPKKSIAFLQADGTVVTVNFDVGNIAALGVLMIGKFQFVRTELLTHQVSEVENARNTAVNFTLKLIHTLDGKTHMPVTAMTQLPVPQGSPASLLTRRYAKELTGVNHTLLFQGAFNLVSVQPEFTRAGQQ